MIPLSIVTTKKDGFIFCSFLHPINQHSAIRVDYSIKSQQEFIEYINNYKIEQAEIVTDDLSFLRYCPTLKHLKIYLRYDLIVDYDFSPLYEHPKILTLKCINSFDSKKKVTLLNCTQINGLENLFVSANNGIVNFNKVDTLKSLVLGGLSSKSGNIEDEFTGNNLDTLSLIECKFKSLQGIENAQNLQCLDLSNNRLLNDIDSLENISSSLKYVDFENNSKVTDFSVLGKLYNLSYLRLKGSNTIPDLKFIKNLTNLKTFIFNFNVLDGDISPCLNLSYVYSERDRKHYNIKDKSLPKGDYITGIEHIDEWRKL